MNEIIEIKKMLDRYYEGESTDADEQRLHEYFASDRVVTELQPYRSIFAYLKREKDEQTVQERRHSALDAESPKNNSLIIRRLRVKPAMTSSMQSRRVKWWYAAASVAACLLVATFFVREYQPKPQTLCTGTYVMVNGVCYDDLALVKKYATETIDMVTKPVGNGSATDALDFLN